MTRVYVDDAFDAYLLEIGHQTVVAAAQGVLAYQKGALSQCVGVFIQKCIDRRFDRPPVYRADTLPRYPGTQSISYLIGIRLFVERRPVSLPSLIILIYHP